MVVARSDAPLPWLCDEADETRPRSGPPSSGRRRVGTKLGVSEPHHSPCVEKWADTGVGEQVLHAAVAGDDWMIRAHPSEPVATPGRGSLDGPTLARLLGLHREKQPLDGDVWDVAQHAYALPMMVAGALLDALRVADQIAAWPWSGISFANPGMASGAGPAGQPAW